MFAKDSEGELMIRWFTTVEKKKRAQKLKVSIAKFQNLKS
jgi:hypothetical protein